MYSMLIDDSSENKEFGVTHSIDKIMINIETITKMTGDVNFEIDLQINNALSKRGSTGVFPLGRYITIFGLGKDEKSGYMFFFDFSSEVDLKENLIKHLGDILSEKIINRCIELQLYKKNHFLPDFDLVELVL